MSAAYERWLVPAIFQPFAVDLARRVASSKPSRILEIGAGTGVLTRELLGIPDVHVTATDFNASMVEVGHRMAPAAAWRQADAMQLPFDDTEFDVIVCQFGVMFFPDRLHAFTEARRVLTPAGHLVLNVWGALDEHTYQRALVDALISVFPHDTPAFMSIPHACADRDALVAEVRAGGFDVSVAETVVLEGRTTGAAEIAEGYCRGTPLRGDIESRGDLEATIALVTASLEAQLGSGPISGTMTAHVVDAVPAATNPSNSTL